jgi:hypothetical protein
MGEIMLSISEYYLTQFMIRPIGIKYWDSFLAGYDCAMQNESIKTMKKYYNKKIRFLCNHLNNKYFKNYINHAFARDPLLYDFISPEEKNIFMDRFIKKESITKIALKYHMDRSNVFRHMQNVLDFIGFRLLGVEYGFPYIDVL